MLSLQNAAQSSTAHHIITVLRANIQILEEVSVIGAGDKNISILHLSCRTSDSQFSLILQTDALVL